jgi:polyhydroxyalkanoate synthesis regulator phasin
MSHDMTDDDMRADARVDKKPGGRRAVTIGLTAGLLGGTAAGLMFGVPGLTSAASPSALVQQVDTTDPTTEPTTAPTTDDTSTDDTTDDTTTDPADPASEPEAEPGARLREILQPLVDDGTITAEQADAVTTQIIENRPERGEGGFGGRHGGGHGPFGHLIGEGSEVLTELLDIDADTLRQQLQDGSSLADIATANGVDPQAVIDALVAEATTRIDQAVADGDVDADRAEEFKADLVDRITSFVNGEFPDRGGFPGGPGRPGDSDEAPTAPAEDVPVTTEN